MLQDRLWAMALVLLAMAPGLTETKAATLSQLELQDDGGERPAHLILTFDTAAPPDLEVRRQTSGLSVWLPGTVSEIQDSDRLRVIRGSDGTEVRLDWTAVSLEAFHINGPTVTIRLFLSDRSVAESDYRLGVGDVVRVSVYRDPDLSGEFPVSPDGSILMPLIGAVPAAGLSEGDLVAQLRQLLGEYLVNPQLSVSVKSYQSQYVVVAQPGGRAQRVALRPGMTLRDVVSEAGVPVSGSQQISLTREGDSGAPMILNGDDLDAQGTLQPRDGDVLTIREPDYIYVSGEVRRPGKYFYSDGLTLQQAITLAEGLTEWASKKEIRIQRRVDENTVDEVVNLKRVQDRKISDPELKPGDLIIIRRRLL